jgi:hypothetical protein
MFKKYKERWAKLEEDHESLRKVRLHFESNGRIYLVGAGCLTAGYLLRRPQKITIVNEAPSIAPVFNNMIPSGCSTSPDMDVVLSPGMADHLKEYGSAMIDMGDGHFVDLIDWSHPKMEKKS